MGQFDYGISLLIGLVAIGHFAYRQLDLPVQSKDLDGFSMLSEFRPSAIASRGLFLEAYFYFAFALVVFYLVVCFSEVAYNFVFVDNQAGSNTGTAFDPDSGTWPLTVALLIIGLSPTFPVLRDIENFFRKLSRHSAGIPHNLVKAYDRLRAYPFETQPCDAEYVKDISRRATAAVFLCALGNTGIGGSAAGFEATRRRLVRFLLLYHWTLSPDGPVAWAVAARAKLRSIFSEREERDLEEQRKAMNGTLRRIEQTDLLDELAATGASLTDHAALKAPQVREVFARHQAQVGDEIAVLAQRMNNLVERLSELELAFCLLIFNDRRKARTGDPVLQATVRHLSSGGAQVTRNLVGTAIFVAAAVCFLTGFLYFVLRDHAGPVAEAAQGWLSLAQTGLRIGFERALGGVALYGAAIVGAVAYRTVRREAGHWSSEDNGGLPRIGRYFGVFAVAWGLATISLYVLWLAYSLYAYDLSQTVDWQLLADDFASYALVPGLVDALVGAFLAAAFVRWLDVHDRERRRAAGVAAVVLWSLLMAALGALLYFAGVLIITDEVGPALLDPASASSKFLELLTAFLAPLMALVSVGLVVRYVLNRRAAAVA